MKAHFTLGAVLVQVSVAVPRCIFRSFKKICMPSNAAVFGWTPFLFLVLSSVFFTFTIVGFIISIQADGPRWAAIVSCFFFSLSLASIELVFLLWQRRLTHAGSYAAWIIKNKSTIRTYDLLYTFVAIIGVSVTLSGFLVLPRSINEQSQAQIKGERFQTDRGIALGQFSHAKDSCEKENGATASVCVQIQNALTIALSDQGGGVLIPPVCQNFPLVFQRPQIIPMLLLSACHNTYDAVFENPVQPTNFLPISTALSFFLAYAVSATASLRVAKAMYEKFFQSRLENAEKLQIKVA